jgi:peroxiredoxin
MMLKRVGLLIVLYSWCLPFLYATNTVIISGKEPSYAHTKIAFYQSKNPFLETEKLLAQTEVDSSGYFRLEFTIGKTQKIFSHLGVFQPYMFVQPGHHYVINLPERTEKTERQQLNPYFKENEIHIDVEEVLDSSQGAVVAARKRINPAIQQFENRFIECYDSLAKLTIHKDIPPKAVDSVIGKLEFKFGRISDHPFFKHYKRYQYGRLRRVAFKRVERRLINDYFAGKPVRYHLPPYMKLFQRLFDRYFYKDSPCKGGKGNLISIINEEKDFRKLNRCIAEDQALENDTLKEMVVLKNLYEGFYQERLADTSLLTVLDSFIQSAEIPFHKSFGLEIKQEVTRLREGTPAPSFSLYNSDSNLVQLNDFQGKYVYLNFCVLEGYTCQLHFRLLGDYRKKFGEHLAVVTIIKSSSFNAIKSFVNQHSYKWTFLHYNGQSGILDEYDVKAFPTYYLIGPEGNFVYSPADPPDKKFPLKFNKLLEEKGLIEVDEDPPKEKEEKRKGAIY